MSSRAPPGLHQKDHRPYCRGRKAAFLGFSQFLSCRPSSGRAKPWRDEAREGRARRKTGGAVALTQALSPRSISKDAREWNGYERADTRQALCIARAPSHPVDQWSQSSGREGLLRISSQPYIRSAIWLLLLAQGGHLVRPSELRQQLWRPPCGWP